MTWRTTAFAFLATSVAWSDGPKWSYARLVDAPLAPVERAAPVKITRVEGKQDAKIVPASALASPPGSVMKAFAEQPTKITEDKSTPAKPSYRVFVGGEVVRQGAFNSDRAYTALQAIIAAGGLKETGKASEVALLHYHTTDMPPTLRRVDLSASLAGKGTNDVWLQSYDVVIVPKAGASDAEVIKSVPAPIAKAARSKMVEAHQVKAAANRTFEGQLPPLPAK